MQLGQEGTDPFDTREKSLLSLLMADQSFSRACEAGAAVVEIRAAVDDRLTALLPYSSVVRMNPANAMQAQAEAAKLTPNIPLLIIRNTLQFLPEVRRVLQICFEKVAERGLLVIIVPHQFLYERKMRLPSRLNPLHRRFYTSNTLLADVEEAIDPTEFRVRSLVENDLGYNYGRELGQIPEGGQDIILVIERLPRPAWREQLAKQERWDYEPPSEFSSRILKTTQQELDQVTYKVIRPDNDSIQRILLIKLDHRGDFLMTDDAFALMRANFPKSEITIVCGSWNRAQAEMSGYCDKVVTFDFFPEDDSARLNTPGRDVLLKEFEVLMIDESYDLAADFRLYDDTRFLLQVVNARHKAGFDRIDAFPWLSIRLNIPSPTVDKRPEQGFIRADAFHQSIGRHRTFEIRHESTARFNERKSLIWGPYRRFPAGEYEFECFIELIDEPFQLLFDIVGRQGTSTLAAGAFDVDKRNRKRVWVNLPEQIPDLELRLLSVKDEDVRPFRFSGVSFLRYGNDSGLHQRESMALLAQLIQLRLRDPYLTAVS